MRRHVYNFLTVWAVLAIAGEAFAVLNFYPVVGAHEAKESDDIFRLLMLLGMPVFAFVVAGVGYSFFMFNAGKPAENNEGGPTMRGTGLAPKLWLAITGSLAIIVMIHPGLTGLANLQADPDGYGWGEKESERIINVTAFRYGWQMEYEGTGVEVNQATAGELVIPVGETVTFRVNSVDVIHSFWIPAFRLKIDALPGRTTFFSVEPTITGSFDDDDAFRVQCAELCGVDHGLMMFPIRVVEPSEFESWLANLQEGN